MWDNAVLFVTEIFINRPRFSSLEKIFIGRLAREQRIQRGFVGRSGAAATPSH